MIGRNHDGSGPAKREPVKEHGKTCRMRPSSESQLWRSAETAVLMMYLYCGDFEPRSAARRVAGPAGL